MRKYRFFITVVVIGLCAIAPAQDSLGRSVSTYLFAQQQKELDDNCSAEGQSGNKRSFFKRFTGCANAIRDGNKGFYPAFASLPPQNGPALGAQFKVKEQDTTGYRLSYNVGGEVSSNGSWTAGAFLQVMKAPSRKKPAIITTTTHKPKPIGAALREPVYQFYAFNTSLQKLIYYGEGQFTPRSAITYFGLQETIAGANVAYPVKFGLTLLGEGNFRHPDLRGRHNDQNPSIEQTFTEASAPGLTHQPSFLQFGEGIRFEQNLGALLALNYTAKLQEYAALSLTQFSFARLTLDFNHDFYIQRAFRPQKGSATTQRVGTIGLRAFLIQSFAPDGNVVPFYFQPTLGGADMDGNHLLASYPDLRFRAPNLMLFRAQYDQPLPIKKLSMLGFLFRAEGGKVALNRSDLDLTHFRHSFATGLTVRAGNVPYVDLIFAWGGHEGTHPIAQINSAGLGSTGAWATLW